MRILAALYPQEKDYYEEAAEALEDGYELHYDMIAQNVYKDDDTMSEAECKEVLDTLEMYDLLQHSYKNLEEKAGIPESKLRFPGYDGNNETKFLAYADYFCRHGHGRFSSLDRPRDFNSHYIASRAQYQRMLEVWKQVRKKITHGDQGLSQEDILSVLDA